MARYADRAKEYLTANERMPSNSPMSQAQRPVKNIVQIEGGEYEDGQIKFKDPKTGQSISRDEYNTRLNEKNPTRQAEMQMQPLEIAGEYDVSASYMPQMPESELKFDTPMDQAFHQSRKPAQDEASLGVLADLVAAGLPTVSGILAGSSPTVMKHHMDRQQKYTDTRGKQLVPSKENMVELMGEDGNPYYELAVNAHGKRPYHQAKLGALGSRDGSIGGGVHSVQRAYDPQSGQPVFVTYYKDGTSSVSDSGSLQPFGGFGSYTAQDINKTKTQRQFIKNDPGRTGVQTGYTPGYGTVVTGNKNRPVPDQTMKTTDKEIDRYRKETSDIVQKRADLEGRMINALTGDANNFDLAGFKTALLFGNTIETRLTDQDAARALGDEFKSYARQFEGFLSRKIAGNITREELSRMERAGANMIDVMNKVEQTVRDETYGTIGQLPGGRDYLEVRGMGPKTGATENKEKREKEKEVRINTYLEDAKKVYPNDEQKQKRYAEFLERKKGSK